MTILLFSLVFSCLISILVMVGVVLDTIGCVFGDLTPFELRFHDRVDFGEYF